jgi:hypothetical protein
MYPMISQSCSILAVQIALGRSRLSFSALHQPLIALTLRYIGPWFKCNIVFFTLITG